MWSVIRVTSDFVIVTEVPFRLESFFDRKAEGVGIVLHNISVIIAMLLVGRMQGVEKCIARCKKAGLFSFGRSRGF